MNLSVTAEDSEPESERSTVSAFDFLNPPSRLSCNYLRGRRRPLARAGIKKGDREESPSGNVDMFSHVEEVFPSLKILNIIPPINATCVFYHNADRLTQKGPRAALEILHPFEG